MNTRSVEVTASLTEPELACVWCGRIELECICEEISRLDLEEQLDELLSDDLVTSEDK